MTNPNLISPTWAVESDIKQTDDNSPCYPSICVRAPGPGTQYTSRWIRRAPPNIGGGPTTH